MIELTDVCFAYDPADADAGSFTLHIDQLTLRAGTRTALVGASGAGKSTLLHLVAGILVPQSGKVVVDGQDIAAMNDGGRRKFRRSSFGLVFQTIELLSYLSLRDNILLPYRLGAWAGFDDAALGHVDRVAERLGLADKLDRPIAKLSQGERQRVAICRAMASSPKVLLADEPTSALDDGNAAAAMDLIFELAEQHGTTLLVLTHDKALLPRFDSVISVENGRVLADGGGA